MERVKITNNKESKIIEIFPENYPAKNLVMQVWLALWSLCGALVVYQLFTTTDSNTKVICIIYMGFWSYFEFLILRIYRWRKKGKEEIEVFKDKITITRLTNNKGLPVEFLLNEISNLRIDLNQKQNMFAKMLFDEYWTAGNECIIFDYNLKKHGFGLQLNEVDAKKVFKNIKK